MTGRSRTGAILHEIIKCNFLALKTVESWTVIIMWKIILNPPGQSSWTAGRIYPEINNHLEKRLKLCLWYHYSKCEPKPEETTATTKTSLS